MNVSEINEKRKECKRFLDDILKPELQRCLERETEVMTEINDYEDLAKKLEDLMQSNEKLKPMVDLGHQKVFCRAEVDNTDFVYVHVGMGFHAELSLSEAIAFAGKRVTFLREQVLRRRSIECEKVRQHITASEMILDGLSAELKMSED